jgi:hypothetical protein
MHLLLSGGIILVVIVSSAAIEEIIIVFILIDVGAVDLDLIPVLIAQSPEGEL